MLDINDVRRVFAQSIAANYAQARSFERALMDAAEYAYRQGLADGGADDLASTSPEFGGDGEE